MGKKINVLLVFANPLNTDRLRLDTEAREIQQSIERSVNRDNINIVTRQATTIRDFRRALLNDTYQIIHISGHGSRSGLILADEQGGQYVADPQAFSDLLRRYSSIECVLLNACYSTYQAEFLSPSIPFTIAMEGPITDSAAIAFSVGFYDALGAKHSVDFAYEEGIAAIKLEISPSARLPKLIRKGEIFPSNFPEDNQLEISERTYIREGKFLLGFAIDLSGSMEDSIKNTADVDMSRLKSIDSSFKSLAKDARKSIQESQARSIDASIDLFAYGFGLRNMPVCDLLSFSKATQEVITADVRQSYVDEHTRSAQEKFKGYIGIGDVLKGIGLDAIYDYGSSLVKQIGKGKITKQLIHDMLPQVEERASEIGDTTLPLEEFTELWNANSDLLVSAKDIILGNTHAEEILSTLIERFKREIHKRGTNTHSVLFLISDGKFAEGELLPLAKQLQSIGVNIVSCFISNQNIVNPRVLLNEEDPQWENEAKLMFRLSSTMGDLPEVRRYLLQQGWTIYPHPRLFVQINHSDVLREFTRVILSMLEDSDAAHTLPKGW